jgi:hypothetical protein
MDRNGDDSEKHRSGGMIGSRQGQIKAALERCGAAAAMFAQPLLVRAAMRHLCVNRLDFSHP